MPAAAILERPVASVRPRPEHRAPAHPARKAVSLRLPEPALALIDRAAEVAHTDRTGFMLAAAVARAENVLLDQTVFQLSESAYNAFVAALDNPAPPTPALKRLARRKPSWES